MLRRSIVINMEKDLLVTLEENFSRFSKGHKLIASYVLEHFDKSAFMTASKLGQTVGVSESTVVRFAIELGFEGYPGFQKALQDLMRNKLTSFQRIDVTSDQIGEDDILEKVLSLDIDRIRGTLNECSKKDFYEAVDKIVSAHSIYVIGNRSSAALASFTAYYLNLIFPYVKLVRSSSTSEMFEQILRVDKKDVAIGFSFPRYSKQTLNALKYAHDNGAGVIAFTDSKNSPLVKYADNVLIAQSDMASFVDSLVAPLSLINALIVAVSMRNRENREKLSNNFKKLEEIWEKYDVYEKSDSDDN